MNVQIEPAPGGASSLPSLATWVPPPGTGAVTAAPVTITTEQAVIQFDRAHPGQPIAVRYPAEGSQELSYPYVLTTTDPLMLAAAERVRRAAAVGVCRRLRAVRGLPHRAPGWPATGPPRSG